MVSERREFANLIRIVNEDIPREPGKLSESVLVLVLEGCIYAAGYVVAMLPISLFFIGISQPGFFKLLYFFAIFSLPFYLVIVLLSRCPILFRSFHRPFCAGWLIGFSYVFILFGMLVISSGSVTYRVIDQILDPRFWLFAISSGLIGGLIIFLRQKLYLAVRRRGLSTRFKPLP